MGDPFVLTRRAALTALAVGAVAACSGQTSGTTPSTPAPETPSATPETSSDTPSATPTAPADPSDPFSFTEVTTFDEPWALAFLPDGRALVTERVGTLRLVDVSSGDKATVAGTPDVLHSGQGGLGDVILAPDFEQNRRIYLSWAESGDGGNGAAVGRGRLSDDGSRIEGLDVIWRQQPKVSGLGHFSHRLAFSPDGEYLFVSSGDRQKFDPAQDFSSNLGKILRLTPDGQAAPGNPFADRGEVAAQIWSYGHRNVLGLAFDADDRLWASEMGPRGGDEINLIERGKNYGWPRASNGSHYDGTDIPDHTSGDGYEAPKVSWNPSISPADLMIYSGDMFPYWKGDAFLGALSGQSLIRVDLDGTSASKGDRWNNGPLGNRIRTVDQGPDGAIWVLTDGGGGQLIKLTPKT